MSGGRRRPLVRLQIVCRYHPDKVLLSPVITTTRVTFVDSPKEAPIGVTGPNGMRHRRRCGEEYPPGSGRRCRITIDFRKDRMDEVLYALWDAMPEPAHRITRRVSDDVMAKLVNKPDLAPAVLSALAGKLGNTIGTGSPVSREGPSGPQ